MTSKRLERFLALAAVGLAAAAWFVGLSRSEADLEPFLQSVFPQAGYIEQTQGGVFAAWDSQDKGNLLGYVSTGSASGYGGE